MKVKHDVANTSRSCLCSSSKRYLYDTRIDKEYYGKCISLREKILLRKLFAAVYDDITQTLAGSNAKLKSNENLRLTEETIKVAKSRLISHALKIVNIDKPANSKILSDCCGCCSYGSTIPLCEHDRRLHRHEVYTSGGVSECSVETAKRVGKRQVKRIRSDLFTYKFNDWKEKEWRTETKKILHRNYVTVFEKPTFIKNYIRERQTRLVNEITNENLTTFKISTPNSQAYKIKNGKIPFEKSGLNQSIYIPKQSPPITHRRPYNFMANPLISLNKINNCEPNIIQRFDKDATGDTILYETVTNIQPIVKRNHENNYNDLIRGALRRCFCTLTLKPHNNQLDAIMASKTVAKSLRHIIRTTLSSQSKSVSERSKKIKNINKKNIAKVRHRSRKNFNIVKEKTKNNIPKLEVQLCSYLNLNVRGSNDHPENNLNGGNNLLARELKKNKLNRNVFCVENTPQMSMNSERQSFRSKESTSPVAKFQFDAINADMKKLSRECNLSYKCISHYSPDCIPEIDNLCSTCQNVIDKKPHILSYECKPFYKGCIPHECFVSTNKIEPNEHRTSNDHQSEPKSTISITQKHIKHMETANVQTSLKSQINKILIDSKLNQAVQVNSCLSFGKEFDEKKSPFLHDAHICQCDRQYKEAGFETIETHLENKELRGNQSKTSETDSSYEKNVCIESDAQSSFCTSKLHKMGGIILGTTVRELRYPKKGHVPKKIQLKSFYQDNDIMRQDFGFFTDISCERSVPCTSNKEKMATDIIIQSKRIIQRTKSKQNFSSPLINKSRQTKIRSYQAAGSEIMNIESLSSQNRKTRHTFVPNGKPYLSNKYRHDNCPIELLRERAVNCKTSFSSFSSTITTTTTSDSNHSFPSQKYKKYKQNTSHRVNSIYKSSFYALNINVKNTRTDIRKNKLERNRRSAEATTRRVTSGTYRNAQKSVLPRYLTNRLTSSTGQRSQLVRISSSFRFDVEFSKSTVPARDFISERKHDRGAVPVSDFISERKQDRGAVPVPDFHSGRKQDRDAASMQTHSNRIVNQRTSTAIQRHQAVTQSYADTQHVGINTHPKRCFCTLKLHKMGRVYREKGVAANIYKPKPNVHKETGTVTTKENSHNAAEPNVLKETGTATTKENSHDATKPNVLKETGTVTTKQNSHNAAFVELDLEPYECEPGTCIPGECDPQKCLKIIKKRKNKTRAVETHMASGQKKDISSTTGPGQKKEISPTMALGQKKDITNYGTRSKQACRITSNFSFSIEFVKYKPKEEAILPAAEEKSKGIFKGLFNQMTFHKKVQSTLQKIACRCKTKYINIQNLNLNKSVQSNVKYQPDDVKKVKGVGQKRRGMGTDIKSKHTIERTTFTTLPKKDKNRKKINKVIKYRLEDLDPYECEPGTCIPGECDPIVCFEIIKKRGMGTSKGTDVKPKHSNEGTTTTHKKKGMEPKAVNTKSARDSGIQGTRALRDHDSHVIPEHYQKPSKTGAILKRCFCTAKLHGIELPPELAPPFLKSKKVKQKATKKITKKPQVHSQNSQTIKPARELNILNLEPYECEPGVCVPGKCDPNICYERIKRRKSIKNISTQSNHDSRQSTKAGKHRAYHDSKSVKVGKHRADHDSRSVKTGKHRAAMSETEKRQDGDQTSKKLSPSVVRVGSSFEFNVEFSKKKSGMDGDGPDNTKPNKKQKMVSGTEVPANPKTKAKVSGHHQPPVQSRDTQVVRKTGDQASGIGIVLRRCFCTLSLQDK